MNPPPPSSRICPTCHQLISSQLLPPPDTPTKAASLARSGGRRGSVGGAGTHAYWRELWLALGEPVGGRGEEGEEAPGSPTPGDGGEGKMLGGEEEEGTETPSIEAGDKLGGLEGDHRHVPSMTPDQLRAALIRVLGEAENLSHRHDTLLKHQLDMELSLKIARSNLSLAEANSELLEEALRRGGEGFAGRMLPPPSRPGTPGSRPGTPSGVGLGRPGVNRGQSMDIPSGAATPHPRKSSDDDFLSRPSLERSASMAGKSVQSLWRKNRPSMNLNLTNFAENLADNIDRGIQNFPSPSTATRNEFFSALGMSQGSTTAGSTPNLSAGTGMMSMSPPTMGPLISPTPRKATLPAASELELLRLRQSLLTSQSTITTLSTQLSTVTASKTALEEELEGLSQALFEEANKMVAEERRGRLEREEEVREVREEMGVLRRTMRVLEGREEEEPVKNHGSEKEEILVKEAEPTTPPPPPEPPKTDQDILEELMKRMKQDFGEL